VWDAARRLNAAGLIRLSAGNISLRGPDGSIAITPAGRPYDMLRPGDIVLLDDSGSSIRSRYEPSSETPMHTAIYRSLPSINAIVHTHSPYAMAFAAIGAELPPICLELVAVGAPVPVASYACPGTQAAGEVAVQALSSRPALRAILLRNHGPLVVGASIAEAYQAAVNLEVGAQVLHLALQTGRSPEPLSEAQVAEIHRVYSRG
jgi:ribulose-5-phosphate 4-epimerase/fuculose-1-phosphate aldolase